MNLSPDPACNFPTIIATAHNSYYLCWGSLVTVATSFYVHSNIDIEQIDYQSTFFIQQLYSCRICSLLHAGDCSNKRITYSLINYTKLFHVLYLSDVMELNNTFFIQQLHSCRICTLLRGGDWSKRHHVQPSPAIPLLRRNVGAWPGFSIRSYGCTPEKIFCNSFLERLCALQCYGADYFKVEGNWLTRHLNFVSKGFQNFSMLLSSNKTNLSLSKQ